MREKNPDDAAAAVTFKVDAVMLSTHNGMTLDYARKLKLNMLKRG